MSQWTFGFMSPYSVTMDPWSQWNSFEFQELSQCPTVSLVPQCHHGPLVPKGSVEQHGHLGSVRLCRVTMYPWLQEVPQCHHGLPGAAV